MAELNSSLDDAAPPHATWSLFAFASLACGILLFVPVLAGIVAVVFGVLGLRETTEPLVRGRRLAITGAVLGLVNLAGWLGYLEFIGTISAPGRTVAHRFVDDLNSGKIANAQGECSGNIGGDQLSAAADQIKNWGGVKHVSVLYITSDTVNSQTTGSVRGNIITPNGGHPFQLHTVGQNTGWKISDFLIQ